ncbi:MAG: hypothetical protein U0271_04045 [Polyangiaceae bacterium]
MRVLSSFARMGWLVALLAACSNGASTGASAEKSASNSSRKAPSASATIAASAPATASALASATASAATSAPAPAEEGVAITKDYPAVGDVETIRETGTSTMKVKVKQGAKEVEEDISEEKSSEMVEECLELAGKDCKKLKIKVNKDESKKTEGGKDKSKPSPIAGKTYIVTRTEGAPEVTLEDGTKASPEEVKAIGHEGLSKISKRLDALPDRVKVGDSLAGFVQAMIADLASDPAKPATGSGSIVVKSIDNVDGKTVVTLDVDLTIQFKQEASDMQIQTQMKGSVQMSADGAHMLKLDFSGPLTLTSPDVNATGTMSRVKTSERGANTRDDDNASGLKKTNTVEK